MSKTICSIIVSYNSGDELVTCFNSIKNQVNYVIIVDNGSEGDTKSILKNIKDSNDYVTIIYNEENLGIAAALNTGVREAIKRNFDYVLTLDHDSEATPDMVENLLHVYNQLEKDQLARVAIAAPILFDKNTKRYQTNQAKFTENTDTVEVKSAITSGSLINCKVFKDVSLFDESLFIYYVDDDFCLRCKNNGWSILLCRTAVLIHQEGKQKIRRLIGRKFIYRNYGHTAYYYISRNTIHMFKSYFKSRKFWSCWNIVSRLCREANKIMWFEQNKSKLIYYMLKGISDGIKGKFGKLEK